VKGYGWGKWKGFARGAGWMVNLKRLEMLERLDNLRVLTAEYP